MIKLSGQELAHFRAQLREQNALQRQSPPLESESTIFTLSDDVRRFVQTAYNGTEAELSNNLRHGMELRQKVQNLDSSESKQELLKQMKTPIEDLQTFLEESRPNQLKGSYHVKAYAIACLAAGAFFGLGTILAATYFMPSLVVIPVVF